MTDAVSALGAEKFVSLTTFKKDGSAVASPLWIGQDGDHVFFWTPADSWKVKRAKNNRNDTEAICEVTRRPGMHFGLVKSVTQLRAWF